MPQDGQLGTAKDGTPVVWVEKLGRAVPVSAARSLGVRPGGGSGKAPPVGIAKLDDTDLDVIGTGSQINARLKPYVEETASGALDLGPVRNVWMKARNWAGQSSPESREYSQFLSDLNKMRNDSLRLNKGTQTEGDAKRAWDELLSNLNDEKLVASRLQSIMGYNDQAIGFHKSKINQRRQLYGMPLPDYSAFDAVPMKPRLKPKPGGFQILSVE